jgi:hypothetical protein
MHVIPSGFIRNLPHWITTSEESFTLVYWKIPRQTSEWQGEISCVNKNFAHPQTFVFLIKRKWEVMEVLEYKLALHVDHVGQEINSRLTLREGFIDIMVWKWAEWGWFDDFCWHKRCFGVEKGEKWGLVDIRGWLCWSCGSKVMIELSKGLIKITRQPLFHRWR